jgi:hypothetical protein
MKKYLYLAKCIKGSKKGFLKYGVTNNIDTRFKFYKIEGLEMELLDLFKVEQSKALDVEYNIKTFWGEWYLKPFEGQYRRTEWIEPELSIRFIEMFYEFYNDRFNTEWDNLDFHLLKKVLKQVKTYTKK